MDTHNSRNYIALDVGDARIGVAYAHAVARLPRPYTTLANDESLWAKLSKIIQDESIGSVIVGLPRNLHNVDTTQTYTVRRFAEEFRKRYKNIGVYLQDEALTSRKAESELYSRGKPFSKGDVDALAATYILEDYLGA